MAPGEESRWKITKLMNTVKYPPTVTWICMCASVNLWMSACKVGLAVISCRVGDIKAARFLCCWYQFTIAPSRLHPIMGEKLPPPQQQQKPLLSAVDCICWNPPRREKWAGWEKEKKNEPTLSHQYFLEPEAVLDLPGSPRQLSFV